MLSIVSIALNIYADPIDDVLAEPFSELLQNMVWRGREHQ